MKETTARNIADGDLLATRLESERLSRTIEHETQRIHDSEDQVQAANERTNGTPTSNSYPKASQVPRGLDSLELKLRGRKNHIGCKDYA